MLPYDADLLESETFWTWANLITVVRLVAGMVIFTTAFIGRDYALTLLGLAVHWLMDLLDGMAARRWHQETRLGAQFDILADRMLITFFYFNVTILYPELIVAAVLSLFQFMVLDHYLSNQFIRYQLLSPNYFYDADRLVWAINWSPLAKLINSCLTSVLLITTRSVPVTVIAVSILIVVKVYSIARLHTVQKQHAAKNTRSQYSSRESKALP